MFVDIATKLLIIGAVAFALHYILKYIVGKLENSSNNTVFKEDTKVDLENDNTISHKPKMLETQKNLLQTYYNKYSKVNTIPTQSRTRTKAPTKTKTNTVSSVGNHKYLSGKKTKRDSFVVIDIETTGLKAGSDEIIEIGAVKVENINSYYHDTFQIFIKPKKEISLEIQNLTGITNDMLLDGDTIDNALQLFLDFIEDYPLVGHNIEFDIKFLDNKMKKEKLNFSNKELIDTLELSRKAFKDIPNHKLVTLKDYLGIYTENHRALSDAHSSLLVYASCIEKLHYN